MRDKILYPVLILIFVFTACQDKKAVRVWREYISPDRRFSVLLPASFDTGSVVMDDTTFGALNEHYLTWRFAKPYHLSLVDDIDIKYIEVNYIDMADLRGRSVETVVDMCIANNLNWYKDQLVRFIVPVRDTMFGGVYVKSFVAEIDAGKSANKICFVKRFMKNSRLYKLNLVAYKDHYRQPEVDSFFNSFKILD